MEEEPEDIEQIAQFLLVAEEPSRFDDLVEGLNEDEELTVTLEFTNSYAEALFALCAGQAQVVSLDAFSYLAARARGCGEALYVLEIEDETVTQGQILADAWTGVYALEGARGRTFCRTDALSIEGWVIPSITMRARGIDPFSDLTDVTDAEDDEAVVRLIHEGECAVGATVLGAEDEVDDLENPGRVVFIEELTPVPNDVIVISAQLNGETQALLSDILRQQRPELAEALGAESLSGITVETFDNLETLLSDAGVDPIAISQ